MKGNCVHHIDTKSRPKALLDHKIMSAAKRHLLVAICDHPQLNTSSENHSNRMPVYIHTASHLQNSKQDFWLRLLSW